jgi:hypothetical protein
MQAETGQQVQRRLHQAVAVVVVQALLELATMQVVVLGEQRKHQMAELEVMAGLEQMVLAITAAFMAELVAVVEELVVLVILLVVREQLGLLFLHGQMLQVIKKQVFSNFLIVKI